MGSNQYNFEIDPRIRPKQFMAMLGCKKTRFYEMIKLGSIKLPHREGTRLTYWHASYVKEVIEKNKMPENSGVS